MSAQAPAAAVTAWISWLRVLAIVGVVTIHTVASTAVADGARGTPQGAVAVAADIGAVFAVPLFVMLSGALTLDPDRYPGAAAFLRRRALRLVPAVVVWHVWYLALQVTVLDRALTPRDVLVAVITGQAYTALYFFWIILGLTVLTPVLVPFLREHGRRGAVLAGLAFGLLTVLTTATYRVREAPLVHLELAWTWWLPYLGVFLLGWALVGSVVRGPWLLVLLPTTVAAGAIGVWQWRNPSAPDLLQQLSPVGYYSALTLGYTVLVYLAGQSLIRPDGPLRALTTPRAAALGRYLGDATLGVFAIHLTVLLALQRTGLLGAPEPAPDVLTLLLRVALVVVLSYAATLLLRRVPGVRRVL